MSVEVSASSVCICSRFSYEPSNVLSTERNRWSSNFSSGEEWLQFKFADSVTAKSMSIEWETARGVVRSIFLDGKEVSFTSHDGEHFALPDIPFKTLKILMDRLSHTNISIWHITFGTLTKAPREEEVWKELEKYNKLLHDESLCAQKVYQNRFG
jgi:hypothetical protein